MKVTIILNGDRTFEFTPAQKATTLRRLMNCEAIQRFVGFPWNYNALYDTITELEYDVFRIPFTDELGPTDLLLDNSFTCNVTISFNTEGYDPDAVVEVPNADGTSGTVTVYTDRAREYHVQCLFGTTTVREVIHNPTFLAQANFSEDRVDSFAVLYNGTPLSRERINNTVVHYNDNIELSIAVAGTKGN